MNTRSNRLFLALLLVACLPALTALVVVSRLAHNARTAWPAHGWMEIRVCMRLAGVSTDQILHLIGVSASLTAVVGAAVGIAAVVVTCVRTHRTIRIGTVAEGAETELLLRLAKRAGIKRLRLLERAEPTAYTSGYVWPAVTLSTGLLTLLDDFELEALLLHEAAHIRRRDPLRMLIVTCIASAFVVAPLVRQAAKSFRTAREIDADSWVVRRMGSPSALASALLVASPKVAGGTTAGFSDELAARVASLEGREYASRDGYQTMSLLGSTVALLFMSSGSFVVAAALLDPHVLHICG